MKLHNPTFEVGAISDGPHTFNDTAIASFVPTLNTHLTNKLYVDQQIGSIGTPNLQSVTNAGNSTTQILQSTNKIQAYTNSNIESSLHPGFLNIRGGSTNHRQNFTASSGKISVRFNSAFYTDLQFPTAAASRTITLQDGSGTLAFLSDIPAGGGTIGGSIADNQIAVGAATSNDIEGSSGLTFNGTVLSVSANINSAGSDGYQIDGIPISALGVGNYILLGDWDGQGYNTKIFNENSSAVITTKVAGVDITGTLDISSQLNMNGNINMDGNDITNALTITSTSTILGSNTITNETDTYGATSKVTKMITCSQAEYDAIGTPNTNTMYIIV